MNSSFQKLWSSGDSAGLLRLARDIEKHETWRGFLTTQEHDIFKYALDSGGSIWHEFINGTAICRMEQPSTVESPANTINGMPLGSSNNTPGFLSKLDKSSFPNGIHNNHHSSVNSKLPSPTPADISISEDSNGSNSDFLQLDGVTVAFRARYMLYEKSIGLMFPASDPSISPDIDYAIFDELENPIKSQEAAPVATRKVDDDDYDDDEDDEDETKNDNKDTKNLETLSDQKKIEKSIIMSRF